MKFFKHFTIVSAVLLIAVGSWAWQGQRWDSGHAEFILFTPYGGLSATDIQSAIEELEDEKTGNSDTDLSSNNWFLDEDNMASDDDTKVPSQQSVKAYVDANAGGDLVDDTTPQLGGNLDQNGNDINITDAGDMIAATTLDAALQENRTAIDLNTTHASSDGTDHANVELNDTHRSSDGTDHANVVLNDTHRASDGTDHTYIDQDVTSGSSPTFAGTNIITELSNDTTPQLGGNLDQNGNAITGGVKRSVTTVNAATYDLLTTDYILNVTYTGTGAVTSLTIPTAQCVEGRLIVIKDAGGNAGTNNITIDTGGGETIDGSATYVMNSDYEAISLYSDGSNLFVY